MFIVKAVIIGMIINLPFGPLGLLTIQKTLNKGLRVGLLAATGVIASDLVYSALAILGISVINDFLVQHHRLINSLTGILFFLVGANLLTCQVNNEAEEALPDNTLHPSVSHFLMGLSNPMTLILFLVLLNKLEVTFIDKSYFILFILTILLSMTFLWLMIVFLVRQTKKLINPKSMNSLNRIIGAGIVVFGMHALYTALI